MRVAEIILRTGELSEEEKKEDLELASKCLDCIAERYSESDLKEIWRLGHDTTSLRFDMNMGPPHILDPLILGNGSRFYAGGNLDAALISERGGTSICRGYAELLLKILIEPLENVPLYASDYTIEVEKDDSVHFMYNSAVISRDIARYKSLGDVVAYRLEKGI
jgi:hypothetical protein